MKQSQNNAAKQQTSDGQSRPEPYLPAMPRLSSEPSRLEQVLRTLFRRRGGDRVIVQHKD